MISELVKELRRAENPCGMVGVGYYRTLYARAADTIEELSAKLAINYQPPADVPDTNVGEWIPCSERLPEEECKVLVSLTSLNGEKIVRTDFIRDGRWWQWHSGFVTAWMPLPEPYKGVE